jgi:trehalose 6-phosphate synthase/phosphatase
MQLPSSRGPGGGRQSGADGMSDSPAMSPRRSDSRSRRTGRVILVSNRLPVSIRVERGELSIAPSSGGLATGLRGYHDRGESVWIGWPGETWHLNPSTLTQLRERLKRDRLLPIELSEAEVSSYYDGFSNSVLWPLLHYQLDRLPTRAEGWETYRRVNQRFADAAITAYRPGDVIWVHDYQLFLVPAMIRARLPDAPLGFFLHVPFPSAEVFRLLPWRRQLLEGMLGASLIGFHTVSYVLHLLTSAANVLGCETRQNRIIYAGRTIRTATFPMGIDNDAFERLAESPEVVAESRKLKEAAGNVALIVSVDRLDYTKGISRRLLTFERLLERYPRRRGRVRLVQVAAPSRASVGEYREIQRTVDELVGRINGRFASPGYDPIHYISQTLTTDHLAAFYRAARVAMITPLRDGMNLVAKEFVASRTDGDGVLVLSEFAGAAAELTDALLVNPYDVDSVAAAVHEALDMPEAERRARMAALRSRVRAHGVGSWADEFISALRTAAKRESMPRSRPPADDPSAVVDRLLQDDPDHLSLLLDYDGSLVGLRPSPAEASPDAEIIKILADLARLPGVDVHVVSGRRRSDLELWLGNLPIGLHAEHGLWSRDHPNGRWHRRDVRASWMEEVRTVMLDITQAVPGSALEEKDASVAWHYRKASGRRGSRAALELSRRLSEMLAGTSATVLRGHKVVEVKDAGISKGLVASLLANRPDRPRLLIIGDDVTDEDMFRAAPSSAVTVKVGRGRTTASMRLLGPDQVRVVLRELIARRGVRAVGTERSSQEHAAGGSGAGSGAGSGPGSGATEGSSSSNDAAGSLARPLRYRP